MDVSHCVELIPAICLRRGLRHHEQDITKPVKGDGFTVQLAYRYACRCVAHAGHMPTFDELPARLRDHGTLRYGLERRWRHHTIDRDQYRAITFRIQRTLSQAAEMFVGLSLLPRRRNGVIDSEAERAPRVEAYRQQVEQLEARYHVTRTSQSDTAARPIYCPQWDITWRSARRAAREISRITGRTVRASDVRSARRLGYRVCGLELLDPATAAAAAA